MRRNTSSRESSLAKDYGIPEDILVSLYSAIGELVFSWALVEANVNYWIAIVYQRAGGKHVGKNKEIPWGMARKIKFLRQCFNHISALEPFKEEAGALLTRAKSVVKTRDIVVHGIVAEYKSKALELLFVRVDLDSTRTMQRFTESWLHINKILDDSGEAIAIGREALKFTERLLEAFFLTDEESQRLFKTVFGK